MLTSLPSPLLSLASHQLVGRGRGSNTWLSPSGCLQFSLLLRVSLSKLPPQKLVFVQYLFGLAIVEACRDMSSANGQTWGEKIRLKWPNDIYAVVGPRDQDRKKIGGILINTSLTGDKVELVIGESSNICVAESDTMNGLTPGRKWDEHTQFPADHLFGAVIATACRDQRTSDNGAQPRGYPRQV